MRSIPCFWWGLQSHSCLQACGKLLPYLSTLTLQSKAVYFCCTILKVALTRRYLAPSLYEVRTFLTNKFVRLLNLLYTKKSLTYRGFHVKLFTDFKEFLIRLWIKAIYSLLQDGKVKNEIYK